VARVVVPRPTSRANSARSGSLKWAERRSTAARSVWWRASAVRLPPGQEPEAVVQAYQELPGRQDAHAGAGQLHGQGAAVQPGADPRHGPRVGVRHGEPRLRLVRLLLRLGPRR
jgi:hypothetical protein